MKKFIYLLSLIAVFQILNTASTNAATTEFEAYELFKTVTLPAGTLVILESSERFHSDEVTVGKILRFKVRANVVVDGQVVITTGALAIGRVKAIKETTYNDPEEVTIELTSVQAVDGRQVPLDGDEQTFRGQFSGQGTIVEGGQTITARVMNNTPVKVN